MRMTRRGGPLRRLLFWLAVLVVLVAVGGAAIAATLYARADTSNVGKLEFANELSIPPLLEPRIDRAGRKIFELELQAGTSDLLPGTQTETWGANDVHLGPTLRVRHGDSLRMEVENQLPETTTVHWHGMHLPADADGGPHQTISPGETWTPEWTVDQPAATLWYHPHMLGVTEDHVYRGIAGLIIVDDPEAVALPLPKRYGVDDFPLIIQDKRLDDDGSLDFSKGMISPTGRLGDTILVNGTFDPSLRVTRERIRLRLLNASNARVYNVGFSDDRPFQLIGTDGGLLGTPERTTRVQLSPGERAEALVQVRPGERVVLRSFEPDLGTNFWDGRFAGGDDTFDLVELRAAARLEAAPEVPERLVRVEELRAPRATRTFELSGQSSINGREMEMQRIDIVASPGAVEHWEVRNASGTPHNFHPHGVHFRVVDYAGHAPPAALAGWKDTVYVPPNESVRFLVRLPEYSDRETPYMFHCHVLQHEDRGMMGQLVVAEGQ